MGGTSFPACPSSFTSCFHKEHPSWRGGPGAGLGAEAGFCRGSLKLGE